MDDLTLKEMFKKCTDKCEDLTFLIIKCQLEEELYIEEILKLINEIRRDEIDLICMVDDLMDEKGEKELIEPTL